MNCLGNIFLFFLFTSITFKDFTLFKLILNCYSGEESKVSLLRVL